VETEHREQPCPGHKTGSKPRKLLSFLLVGEGNVVSNNYLMNKNEKAWGKHIRAKLKERELSYLRQLKTAIWEACVAISA